MNRDFHDSSGGMGGAGAGGRGNTASSVTGPGGSGGVASAGGEVATTNTVGSGGAGGAAPTCTDGTFKKCSYTGSPATEGKGPCKAGTQSCSNGVWGTCSGEVLPVSEKCNNADDDCDGVVDNGNPEGGMSCDTGKKGVCAAGAQACTGGALVCVQTTQSSADICDGKDNNCDGTIDNGTYGAVCVTGLQGICALGHEICSGGALACIEDNEPQAKDPCNGLDNNCDGIVDSQQCFVAGTRVTMADGTARSIEEINVGEWVLGYDVALGKIVAAPVLETFVHPLSAGSSALLRINESLRVTGNHPFYANGQWIPAEALSLGDSLVVLDQAGDGDVHVAPGTVTSLFFEAQTEATYNLEVAGVHDYFAGGVLVHNKQLCP